MLMKITFSFIVFCFALPAFLGANLLQAQSFQPDSSLYQSEELQYDGEKLLYRILYPENFDPDQKYPVILFLHGAGERGNDNQKQLTHGSSLFLEIGRASCRERVEISVGDVACKSKSRM